MSYMTKMFGDSPGVQSRKKCIQIIFLLCTISQNLFYSRGTADENGGH